MTVAVRGGSKMVSLARQDRCCADGCLHGRSLKVDLPNLPQVSYWERRYKKGGNSGAGSRGSEAEEKARLVSAAVADLAVTSLLDIGCGDGYVASLLHLGDCLYVGVDPSPSALKQAREANPERTFVVLEGDRLPMDAHLSMDVIFHLTVEQDYRRHLDQVFSARRIAMVYATNHDHQGASHVLHRQWTPDVPDGWVLDSFTQVTEVSAFRVFVRDT